MGARKQLHKFKQRIFPAHIYTHIEKGAHSIHVSAVRTNRCFPTRSQEAGRGEMIPIHGVTLPQDCAPEAHFGADFYPLNLERIAVACNSSFPLPARLLDYCPLDQHMHYGHVMPASSSTFIR